MNYFDDLIDDFKDGNDQHRLDLYMNHRNLRSEFDQIESEENTLQNTKLTDSKQVVIKPNRVNKQQSLLVRMKQWCFSILS